MATTLAIEIALAARDRKDRETLFWSERGEVACAMHAPYPGSDTWNWERWTVMTEEHKRQWAIEVRRPAACEIC